MSQSTPSLKALTHFKIPQRDRAACAETYRRDTYHLITAGLRGGKGTPEQVATHPRVFATFTAQLRPRP